jgi:hypothetical protein
MSKKLCRTEVSLSDINEPRKLTLQITLQMKNMLMTFFDIKGNVHFGFIPKGQRVTQVYYMETVKPLHEAVCRRGLNFGKTMTMLQFTKRFLSSSFWPKNYVIEMGLPPHSPDLAANDFCFQK